MKSTGTEIRIGVMGAVDNAVRNAIPRSTDVVRFRNDGFITVASRIQDAIWRAVDEEVGP